MTKQIQIIAANALRVLDLCQDIASDEYSAKGVNRRLDRMESLIGDMDAALGSIKPYEEDNNA